MDDRKDITVPMPGWMVDDIEAQLAYGDSRAGWIREAARMRLEQMHKEQISEETETEGNATESMATGTN